MIKAIKINDKQVYDYKEFVVDTLPEISYLPKNVSQGSICFVIETSDVYMLNGQGEWVQI